MSSLQSPSGSNAGKTRNTPTVLISVASVSVALVFVVTYLTANYTIPITKGYFDFGDVIIFTVAFAFGPIIGGLAGGIGSSLSDQLSVGSQVYAPFTLVIKGLEGAVAGYLAFHGARDFRLRLPIAWAVGSAVMVAGYFLAETLAIVGYPASLVDVFVNVTQVLVGGIIGIPLSQYLRRTLPTILIYSRKSPSQNAR